MAIKACEIIGLNKNKITKSINKIKSVKGRLELVRKFKDNSKVYVDFAHTPDAINTAVTSLKKHYKTNVTIVFGCGGERDKNKRGKIGKLTDKICNKIYITDDNPRGENPKLIRKSIIKHINKKKVTEIGSRYKAIHSAIRDSNPNEVILIAGKGHEDIQDYGKKKYKVSDFNIVKEFKTKEKKYF